MPEVTVTLLVAVAIGIPLGSVLNSATTGPVMQPACVSVHMLDATKLASLFSLDDDWDGEGAPRPSTQALGRADHVIRWAHENGLVVTEVDADVLGGVAVRLQAHVLRPVRTAWVACMNNSRDTLVMSEDGRGVVSHEAWGGTDSESRVWSFLSERRS